jgi:hypothetical protein
MARPRTTEKYLAALPLENQLARNIVAVATTPATRSTAIGVPDF